MHRLLRIFLENPQAFIPVVILFLIFNIYREFKDEKATNEQFAEKNVKEEKFDHLQETKSKKITRQENLSNAEPQRSIASIKDEDPAQEFKEPGISPTVSTESSGMVAEAETTDEEHWDEAGQNSRNKNQDGDNEDNFSSTYVENHSQSPIANSPTLTAPTTPPVMSFGNVGFYNPAATTPSQSGNSGTIATANNTSSSSGGSSTTSIACTLAPTPSAGEYVTNPTISFSGSCTDIYYTVNSGTCLDPIEFGTNFSGASVAVGSSNGEYCVSYYGSKSGKSSSVQYATYTIDDSDIPLIFAPVVIPRRVQTNQVYKMNAHNSTEFGKTGYEFFAYNIGNVNPSTLTSNCEQLAESSGYNLNTHGMRSPAGNLSESTSSLDQLESILIPLSYQNGLNYGDNTILSFMQFTDPNGQTKYGCVANQVELFDFPVGQIFLNSNHQTPATTHGAHVFQGGIKAFGHFNLGATSGSGTGKVGNNVIQTDYINVTN